MRAKETIPFSAQSVADGHWEVYHDDDCGGVITPYPENLCLKCGMHPDFQSRGARRTTTLNIYTYRCAARHVFELEATEEGAKLARRLSQLVACPECKRPTLAKVILPQHPWTFTYYTPELRDTDICPINYHDTAHLIRFEMSYKDFDLDFNTGLATCKHCGSSIQAMPVGYERLRFTDIHMWAIAHKPKH